MRRVPESAPGPGPLSAVRADGVPRGRLLQVQEGGGHAQGGREAQHRLWGRDRPLHSRRLFLRQGHPRQQGRILGLCVRGRSRRGGHWFEVSYLI